jgi:hypothetical protein
MFWYSLKSMNIDLLNTYFIQFRDTMLANSDAVIFIRKNKLWVGFWKYGWVAKTLVFLAILLGLKFLVTFVDWWNTLKMDDPGEAVASVGHLFQNVAFEGYEFLFVGGMKYTMLILLEVIIFHMSRGTLEILTGNTSDLSFNSFIKAQIRMIKVAVRSYVFEMVISVLISIAFGIFGALDFLEPILEFAVHSYFIGFIVFDNYSEQFDLSIKESVRYARKYIGVCLALGLTTNVLLLIPIAGTIIAPLIVAVTVTLVMYHISDLHLLSEQELKPVESPG